METEQVPGPPDDELVRKVQAGNNHAFELLARRYYRSVFSLVAAHLSASNEVEDVVQDTFLAVFQKIGSFKGESAFETWLTAIAVNQVSKADSPLKLPIF